MNVIYLHNYYKMKQILSLLILFVLLACGNENHRESPILIDLSSDIVIPKHYIVTRCNEQIAIDGVANESCWQSALFSDSFIDIEGIKTPKYNTKVKMLWDDNYLYVYSQMEEPHIWGNLKQRDIVIYYNNDFEVFIDPSMTAKSYVEIEINALGTVWDLLLDKPYRVGGKAINHWNLDELKSAVKIYGSLNNHTDIDSLWCVEMAIPIKPLIELRDRHNTLPVEGEQWRINFSRVEWDYDIINGSYQRKKENGKFLKEYNWVWSNQKTINMHEPEKWGIIQFTNELSSENIKFIEDEHMLTKQIAYALFRQTNFGSLRELLQQNVGYIQKFKVTFSDKESLYATFYKTNFGFEFKIKTTQSDKTFIINEKGVLKSI